ncbi:hypothetical protein SYN65AY640_03285 [Synechococcus sp. 65AY640]|jgi:hypothetical protein|nr:hypothetical protein SYN65AY640_03285 [Synechococcus sp. 65AY640]
MVHKKAETDRDSRPSASSPEQPRALCDANPCMSSLVLPLRISLPLDQGIPMFSEVPQGMATKPAQKMI